MPPLSPLLPPTHMPCRPRAAPPRRRRKKGNLQPSSVLAYLVVAKFSEARNDWVPQVPTPPPKRKRKKHTATTFLPSPPPPLTAPPLPPRPAARVPLDTGAM